MRPAHWLHTIPLRLRSIFRRHHVEADLDDELRFHLESQVERNIEQGMTPQEARREALLALGGLDQCKEECRDQRRLNLADDFVKDLGYAARILRHTPAFAITAVGTIALGIGAATAVFSVANAVLLRPLPYRAADRLVLIKDLLSNAYFHDLRNGTANAFQDMASVMVFRAVVPREDGTAERISKGLISTNFFHMLGAHIVVGRDFLEAEGRPHGQPPPPYPPPEGNVAILSYEYFQQRYNADPAVLGRYMPGNGRNGPRIVGVIERGFKLVLPAGIGPRPSPDVWIANDRGYDEANRGGLMLQVVGVLRPGVTLAAAQSEADRLGEAGQANPLHARLESWHRTLVAEVRPALLALLGAVTFLLLIACANVANLLLVRASQREHELAVRAALGAGSGRLTRQMLAEAVLLCGVGTLLGVGLAWLGIREVLLLAPSNLPRLESTSIDWPVLAFSALAGLLEAAILGALPSWRAARPDVIQVLRGTGRLARSRTGSLLRASVVVAEVALSFVLLVGAGLMLRSYVELRRVDPGYDAHGLLTFLTVGDAQGFQQPQRRQAFLRDLEDRLRAIPGVESVGASTGLPLQAGAPAFGIKWCTARMPAVEGRIADIATVMPGYFETLRAPVLEGRTLNEADNAAGRPVAVIDAGLAAKAFPGGSAIGQRICAAMPGPMWLDVVGVVRHQHLRSLTDPGPDQIFVTDGFWGIGISRHWALRTAGDPAGYAATVRDVVAKYAPGRLAVTEMRTMETTVDQSQTATRFHLLLIGVFAGLAVVLAGLGLYGVLSSAVRQRTPEIGIRIALGAAPGTIFRLVIGQGIALSAVGVVIGFIAARGVTRVMISMLVGVKPTDPSAFALMTVVFFVVAAIACWVPARRAAALDPTIALREE